jgi:alanine-glyoxylate transaminase / serine-glyoxylate transaminase / serine-pyruvate transaminase
MDDVLLLTPGPTPIHPWAQAALGWPMRGHMDADVFAYNDAIVADLRRLYRAPDDAFTSLLAGSGSLGMEAGLANLLEPGERVLVATNGVFGDRMATMAERLGAEVHVHRVPPGEPLTPEGLRAAAERARPHVVALVHGETSTGVLNPVADLAAVVGDVGALWSVDAVTTVGMLPFDMAGWGIDYAYTGSQKCLSAPPGLAPVAVSARAMAHVAARRTPVVTWYADLVGMQGYWTVGEGGRRYHHTVPIHLHWATGEAIRAALEEGVEARSERARRVGAAVAAALATVGFGHLVAPEARLPTVLALTAPGGFGRRCRPRRAPRGGAGQRDRRARRHRRQDLAPRPDGGDGPPRGLPPPHGGAGGAAAALRHRRGRGAAGRLRVGLGGRGAERRAGGGARRRGPRRGAMTGTGATPVGPADPDQEVLRVDPRLLDVAASLFFATFPTRRLGRGDLDRDGRVPLATDPPWPAASRERWWRALEELLRQPFAASAGAYLREVRDGAGRRDELALPVAPAAFRGGAWLVGPFEDEAAAAAWARAVVRPPWVHDLHTQEGASYVDVFVGDPDVR